jgi:hypothetical protein
MSSPRSASGLRRLFADIQRALQEAYPGCSDVRLSFRTVDGRRGALPVPALPETWPPPAGWAFRPGSFAYRGRTFKLSGKLWELLQLLAAHAGEPVEVETIADVVWGDSSEASDGNIRNHASMLRRRLRAELGTRGDPIERAGGAYVLTLR